MKGVLGTYHHNGNLHDGHDQLHHGLHDHLDEQSIRQHNYHKQGSQQLLRHIDRICLQLRYLCKNRIHFRYKNHGLIHRHYIHNVDNQGIHGDQQSTDHIYLQRCFLCKYICHLRYKQYFQILVHYKCILIKMIRCKF